MKKTILLACILALVAGCARFSTKQTDLSYDPTTGKIARKIVTGATSFTLFSSKSALTKLNVRHSDKSQGATVGTLDQQADATNIVEIIKALEGLVEKISPK